MVLTFTHGLTLAYRNYGRGPVHVMAFHGFGRTGSDFAVLEPELGERYTLHAFDLPFHGQSPHPPGRTEHPFTARELGDFVRGFAEHIGAANVVVMGYSLGGRVVLSLLATVPERIARAVLIAPDGLHPNPWYRALASQPWGRRLYARFLDDPRRIQALIRWAHRLGLITSKLDRFITDQIATREKRQLIHDVWLSFRNIEVDLRRVAHNVDEHHIPLDLVFGRHDSVIKPSLGRKLARHGPAQLRIHQLEGGHVLLTPAFAPALGALLP